jgi:hypothetical protein
LTWDDHPNAKTRLTVTKLAQHFLTAGVSAKLPGRCAVALSLKLIGKLPYARRATGSEGLAKEGGSDVSTFTRDGGYLSASFQRCRFRGEALGEKASRCGKKFSSVLLYCDQVRIDRSTLSRPRADTLGVPAPGAEGEKKKDGREHGFADLGQNHVR